MKKKGQAPVTKLPVRLGRDPIIEAVFEIRFQSKVATVSELLPGLLYSKIKDDFASPERLFPVDLPAELLESDPNLKYQPRLRMRGNQYAILIGDRSVIVSCAKPYPGWAGFRIVILEVLGTLKETGLITAVERFSIKYVNLLSATTLDEQLGLIHFKSTLGRHDLTNCITTTAVFEIVEDGLNNIVEIKSNVSARTPDGVIHTGLFVSVDTINLSPQQFWEEQERHIDVLHDKEKEIFFNLLTNAAMEQFEPQWE